MAGAADAGTVTVLGGTAGGLSADGARLWSEDRAGVLGRPEANDWFGR